MEANGKIRGALLVVTGRVPLLDAKNLTGVFSGYSLTGPNSILVGKDMLLGKFKWLKNHRYLVELTGGGILYGYHLIFESTLEFEVFRIGYEYIR